MDRSSHRSDRSFVCLQERRPLQLSPFLAPLHHPPLQGQRVFSRSRHPLSTHAQHPHWLPALSVAACQFSFASRGSPSPPSSALQLAHRVHNTLFNPLCVSVRLPNALPNIWFSNLPLLHQACRTHPRLTSKLQHKGTRPFKGEWASLSCLSL